MLPVGGGGAVQGGVGNARPRSTSSFWIARARFPCRRQDAQTFGKRDDLENRLSTIRSQPRAHRNASIEAGIVSAHSMPPVHVRTVLRTPRLDRARPTTKSGRPVPVQRGKKGGRSRTRATTKNPIARSVGGRRRFSMPGARPATGVVLCSPCGAGGRYRHRRCPRCCSTIRPRPSRAASGRRSGTGWQKRRTTRARSSRRRWRMSSRTRLRLPTPAPTCSSPLRPG